MVEVPALAQEPQGVARGDPVVAVVLAGAVAGDDVVPGGERAVHLLDIVGGEEVIGVKDEVAIVSGRDVPRDMGEERLEGVALTDLLAVEALIDNRAALARDARGVVGAVVRQHEDVQQTLRRRFGCGDCRCRSAMTADSFRAQISTA